MTVFKRTPSFLNRTVRLGETRKSPDGDTDLLDADAAGQPSTGSSLPTSRHAAAEAPASQPALAARAILFYWGNFQDGQNGSQRRVSDLLRFLEATFSDVVVYSYENHPSRPWTDAARSAFAAAHPEVRLELDQETPALAVLRRFKKLLILLLPLRFAGALLRLSVDPLTPNYARLKREAGASVTIVNYIDSLAQLNGIDPSSTLCETHDVRYFRRVKATGESTATLASLLSLRSEIATLAALEGVIAITAKEDYFFRNALGHDRVYYVPEYRRQRCAPAAGGPYRHDLVFVASDNDMNVMGFRAFFEANADWLDHYRIALCGKICEAPAIRAIAERHDSLTLFGYLSDEALDALYAHAKASLSPTEGTGLKIKLVESLRHGRPVFASRHSMEGLPPGYEGCVLPIDRRTVEETLADTGRLERASAAAIEYYARFASAGDLDHLLERLGEITASAGRG